VSKGCLVNDGSAEGSGVGRLYILSIFHNVIWRN
jgi:hypothetical protein